MITWIILAEIAFWIVIVLGLTCRYVLKKPKLSILFFVMTPVIDLLLVLLTMLDLKSGAPASISHGIAAIYIGVSIAYGKSMIAWADEKFQQWYLKIKTPNVRLTGKAKGIHEIKMFVKHVIAYMIGASLLWGITAFVGHQGDTSALLQVMKVWGIILVIDGIVSFSYILFPKK